MAVPFYMSPRGALRDPLTDCTAFVTTRAV